MPALKRPLPHSTDKWPPDFKALKQDGCIRWPKNLIYDGRFISAFSTSGINPSITTNCSSPRSDHTSSHFSCMHELNAYRARPALSTASSTGQHIPEEGRSSTMGPMDSSGAGASTASGATRNSTMSIATECGTFVSETVEMEHEQALGDLEEDGEQWQEMQEQEKDEEDAEQVSEDLAAAMATVAEQMAAAQEVARAAQVARATAKVQAAVAQSVEAARNAAAAAQAAEADRAAAAAAAAAKVVAAAAAKAEDEQHARHAAVAKADAEVKQSLAASQQQAPQVTSSQPAVQQAVQPAAPQKPAQPAPQAAQQSAAPAPQRIQKQTLLGVFPLLPHALRREVWRLDDFEIEKLLHNGYASKVYKVSLGCMNTGTASEEQHLQCGVEVQAATCSACLQYKATQCLQEQQCMFAGSL